MSFREDVKMDADNAIKQFVKERNEALLSLDKEKITRYMEKRGIKVPKNELIFWGGVYKSICNITDAPPEIKDKASAWLKSHGMDGKIC